LLLLIQSCAVVKEQFYYPIAVDGLVVKESCRGKVGADNVLILNLNDVSVSLQIQIMGDTQWFGVILDIPENVQVAWPRQDIVGITENETFDLTIDSFKQVIGRGDNYETANTPVGVIMENTTDEEYFESVKLSHSNFSELIIEGLTIIVNGETLSIPKIRFEKREGLFLHPLNC
jgi:hypothetical protein